MSRLSQCFLKFDVPAENRMQAVQEAGRLLLSYGCVTPRYLEAVGQNISEEDCIVILPWLAIVNFQDEQQVLKGGMGLVTLHRPVPFDDEEINLVKVVMALAARTMEEQMWQIEAVARLIVRSGRMDQLWQAESEEQVRRILNWQGCSY